MVFCGAFLMFFFFGFRKSPQAVGEKSEIEREIFSLDFFVDLPCFSLCVPYPFPLLLCCYDRLLWTDLSGRE